MVGVAGGVLGTGDLMEPRMTSTTPPLPRRGFRESTPRAGLEALQSGC